MKYLFYIFVGVTLFFSLSAGQITPAIVVNHDKLAHFVVFFALSFLINISFPTHHIEKLLMVMVSLAISIEITQYYFTNRELSVVDIGASITGIIGYMIVMKLISKTNGAAEKVYKHFEGLLSLISTK